MLRDFARSIDYSLLGMQAGTSLVDAVKFFICDVVKIFLLLSIIILVVSIIRSYFPPENTNRILSHKKEFIGNILVELPAAATPFFASSAGNK